MKALKVLANPQEKIQNEVTEKLRQLVPLALESHNLKFAGRIAEALLAWGETGILMLIRELLRGVDDEERHIGLRLVESIAPLLAHEDREYWLSLNFTNPEDDNNTMTLLYQRALHALASADKDLAIPDLLPMTEAMEEARELSPSYGKDSWQLWRIVECETIAMFKELDLDQINFLLYSSDTAIREAAEKAYSSHGKALPSRQTLTWIDVWKIVDESNDNELAAKKLADVIQTESTVSRSAAAGWLWSTPAAEAADALARVVERELNKYSSRDTWLDLPTDLEWIIRALARHAKYSSIAGSVLERCLNHDYEEISNAVIKEIEQMPPSMAPSLIKLATDRNGWRRSYIAKWAADNQSAPAVATALKSAKITAKKLTSWIG
jgi:hypothetical protein